MNEKKLPHRLGFSTTDQSRYPDVPLIGLQINMLPTSQAIPTSRCKLHFTVGEWFLLGSGEVTLGTTSGSARFSLREHMQPCFAALAFGHYPV